MVVILLKPGMDFLGHAGADLAFFLSSFQFFIVTLESPPPGGHFPDPT